MISFSFHSALEGLKGAFLLFFLCLAIAEIYTIRPLPSRVWKLPLFYCLALLLFLGTACLAIGLAAGWQGAATACARLIRQTLPQIVLAYVFLAAALALEGASLSRILRFTRQFISDAAGVVQSRSERTRIGRKLLEALGFLATMLLFSMLWLHLAVHFFGAHIDPRRLETLRPSRGEPETAAVLSSLFLIIMAPFLEEVMFRGYIQQKIFYVLRRPSGLAYRKGAALAIAVPATAALWAMIHSGVLVPDWVKWIQIFGVGVVIGSARHRLGLGACIMLHLFFNMLGGLYAPPDISRSPQVRTSNLAWAASESPLGLVEPQGQPQEMPANQVQRAMRSIRPNQIDPQQRGRRGNPPLPLEQ